MKKIKKKKTNKHKRRGRRKWNILNRIIQRNGIESVLSSKGLLPMFSEIPYVFHHFTLCCLSFNLRIVTDKSQIDNRL